MSTPQLILASGSPRRRQLLAAHRFEFEVVVPDDSAENQGLCSQCGPAEFVVDLARAKAADVQRQLANRAGEFVLLAADTVAECDGMILGKPVDESHARDMLERLSSRRHRVYTGISLRLLHRGRLLQEFNEFVVTTLQMDSLSGDMLEQYLESGQWEGKAGAFGYQDGLDWVRVVAGSESNVVGLPMERVCELLADLGVGRGD